MPGELLNREVTRAMPVADSRERTPGGHEVRKIMSTRLRSGVKVAGTPRFGKKLDSMAVRIKAVQVKKSGEKRARVFIFFKSFRVDLSAKKSRILRNCESVGSEVCNKADGVLRSCQELGREGIIKTSSIVLRSNSGFTLMV